MGHRPEKLSLGPLEREILELLWAMHTATVRQIHDRLLADPNRELTSASVMTVLQRLRQKGWTDFTKRGRILHWYAKVTAQEAQTLEARDRLQKFLAVSNPDVVAAFADELDRPSLEQFEAIAQRLRTLREQQS